jgi:RsiW-degrading membrane proteinase PrsW (M82 family)
VPGSFLNISISLLPVALFLLGLRALDSYKLVDIRRLGLALLAGALVAGVSYVANSSLLESNAVGGELLRRYVAPLIEEALKAGFVTILLVRKRVGFVVDAAIFGFGTGAGFAVVENVYYLSAVADASIGTWLVRGFGTAIMHGGTTAIYGIVSKTLVDKAQRVRVSRLIPGFAVAFLIHSAFNHLALQAIVLTAAQLLVLPLLIMLVFNRSEEFTRRWLGVGFDTDQELLELIKKGDVSMTPVGRYLHDLRARFEGEVVADMLCWLRIRLELTIKAKGIMLMREAGFKVSADPTVKSKFAELEYLEKSIGKTGLLAISPCLHHDDRDLWQIHFLSG